MKTCSNRRKGKEKYGNETCKSSETKDRVYDVH